MSKQKAWVQHVDYGRIVHLATQTMKLLIRRTAPKRNVEYLDAASQQRIGKAHLPKCFYRLWLEAVGASEM